jgi:hypothetical protein
VVHLHVPFAQHPGHVLKQVVEGNRAGKVVAAQVGPHFGGGHGFARGGHGLPRLHPFNLPGQGIENVKLRVGIH